MGEEIYGGASEYSTRKAEAVRVWEKFRELRINSKLTRKIATVMGLLTGVIVVILFIALAQSLISIREALLVFLSVILILFICYVWGLVVYLERYICGYTQFVREHPDHATYIDPLED